MKALGQARSALSALAALLPDEAERLTNGGELRDRRRQRVAHRRRRAGPRRRAAARRRRDRRGIRRVGRVHGDRRVAPVARNEGDRVVAGTVSTDSSIRVRVDAVGERHRAGGDRASRCRGASVPSRAQALADRFAALLFYVASLAGVATFVTWTVLGSTDDAVVRTVTVLVIACPHALGLAIPLVVSLSSALAARAGMLVRNRLALERMRTIDAVLFDKTGTLTEGPACAVVDVVGADVDDRGCRATRRRRRSRQRAPAGEGDCRRRTHARLSRRATGFRAITGRGVEATIDGVAVRGRRSRAGSRAQPQRARGDRRTHRGMESPRGGGALPRPQ